MPVLKADAYGHGLIPVAGACAQAGSRWLGVATVAEGAALRRAGVDAEVVVLCSAAPGEEREATAHSLLLTAGDFAAVGRIADAGASGTHIEIETGMGRAGVLPCSAVDLFERARSRGLQVTGLMTHFAEGADVERTRRQVAAFEAASRALAAAGARFDETHLANSAALLACGPCGGTLVRAGLLIYGIVPGGTEEVASERLAGLRPALTLRARVGSIRRLTAGAQVGYGGMRTLRRPTSVATVLIGYGDGLSRRLSDRGAVLLHGRRAPILGTVCMDQTMVDVTDIPLAAPGDVAVCIGPDGGDAICAEELAGWMETTEHEVTTALTARLPRVYLP